MRFVAKFVFQFCFSANFVFLYDFILSDIKCHLKRLNTCLTASEIIKRVICINEISHVYIFTVIFFCSIFAESARH